MSKIKALVRAAKNSAHNDQHIAASKNKPCWWRPEEETMNLETMITAIVEKKLEEVLAKMLSTTPTPPTIPTPPTSPTPPTPPTPPTSPTPPTPSPSPSPKKASDLLAQRTAVFPSGTPVYRTEKGFFYLDGKKAVQVDDCDAVETASGYALAHPHGGAPTSAAKRWARHLDRHIAGRCTCNGRWACPAVVAGLAPATTQPSEGCVKRFQEKNPGIAI